MNKYEKFVIFHSDSSHTGMEWGLVSYGFLGFGGCLGGVFGGDVWGGGVGGCLGA